MNRYKLYATEKLEVVDDHFAVVRDSSVMNTHDPACRDRI